MARLDGCQEATGGKPMDEDELPLEASDLATEAEILCPYCGEIVVISIDPGGGEAQEYVQDCEVCCRPWLVQLNYNTAGAFDLSVQALD